MTPQKSRRQKQQAKFPATVSPTTLGFNPSNQKLKSSIDDYIRVLYSILIETPFLPWRGRSRSYTNLRPPARTSLYSTTQTR